MDAVRTEDTIIRRCQKKIPHHDQRCYQHEQGWQDALGTGQDEGQDGKIALLEATHGDAGHQETGNDKKHVNTDEAAAHFQRPKVKQDNRNDCPSAQAVDVEAKSACCVRWRRTL